MSNNKQWINTKRTTGLEWTAVETTGEGLKCILQAPNLALESTIITVQKLFSSRGGFLTSQRKNLIKLKHYGRAKKMAHDSQIDKVKETIKLNHGEPSKETVIRQQSTDGIVCQDRHWVWGLTHRRTITEDTIAINHNWVYNQTCLSMLLDRELLIDPSPRGNFVHYDFLKIHYIRSKMTLFGHLAVRALPCNSHVNELP